ncbi:hypothetical protein, partial [Pseudomonas sp. FW300-N1A5]|uniref:hypothetical protein n=1 Tax=Pseudomonas sp. FW300-N1A5 TaxID=2070664 RepID=UPI001C45C810
MESLVEDKKKQKAPERICLGQEEVVKVDAWLMQVNESSRGFLTLSKSDIANWAIRSHREELSSKELSQIRQYH